MTIKFIKGMSDQPSINIWSKEWPNWSGVVPQVGDIVLLHFGDNNEECCMFKVTHRFIDGTQPDIVTCMIAEEKMRTAQNYTKRKIIDLDINIPIHWVRFVNGCKANDIETVEQLLQITPLEFSRFRNCGLKGTLVIRDALKEKYGIDWR